MCLAIEIYLHYNSPLTMRGGTGMYYLTFAPESPALSPLFSEKPSAQKSQSELAISNPSTRQAVSVNPQSTTKSTTKTMAKPALRITLWEKFGFNYLVPTGRLSWKKPLECPLPMLYVDRPSQRVNSHILISQHKKQFFNNNIKYLNLIFKVLNLNF